MLDFKSKKINTTQLISFTMIEKPKKLIYEARHSFIDYTKICILI